MKQSQGSGGTCFDTAADEEENEMPSDALPLRAAINLFAPFGITSGISRISHCDVTLIILIVARVISANA